MDTPRRSLHPMIWVASSAVTLLSLTGIAALTGWLPIHRSEPAPVEISAAASAPLAAASVPEAVASAPLAQTSAPLAQVQSAPVAVEEKPAPAKPEAKPASREKRAKTVAEKPHKTASEKTPTHASSTKPGSAPMHPESPTAVAAPEAKICEQCGVIEQIRTVQAKGQGSGLGAVGGAVIGGVLGNQVGRGSGRTAARIGGAILGGLAGNEVEKNARTTEHYVITVRMDDGSRRTIEQKSAPQWSEGQKVRLDGDTIHARDE
ncbi:glycine zipper 2TM domain-containing protein [Niveibacterium terrae]|uniref:glycine zipper 2TM domain-containing protein n=1 Tax=Niveibacterium terrae TaxID=3373598 RepID=UPI003A94560F